MRAGELPASALEGAVLYGPPGTGKTMLAKSLAAAAEVPCLITSVGSWFSQSPGHLDEVIKAVDAFCDGLISASKSSGTAVGLLDELDAIPNRATMDNRAKDWWLPVITYCLIRIQALRERGIILLAATNHLDAIDSALLRPGRFDRAFHVGPPDEAGRLGILRAHLGDDLVGADLTPAARLCAGATGAVLAGFVKGARKTARKARRAMELGDLLAEVAPPETRSPATLRSVALHEAGHAVGARRMGLGVRYVTTRVDEDAGGSTGIAVDDVTPDRAALERQVVGLLCGRAADALLGDGPDSGAGSDLLMATRMLCAVHVSFGLGSGLSVRVHWEEAERLLRDDPRLAELVEADLMRLMREAERLVAAHARAVEAVSAALIARRVLDGAEVDAIMAAHPPRVRIKAGRELVATPPEVVRTEGTAHRGASSVLLAAPIVGGR